jgi:cell division septum initiation protein DivIVA
MASAARRPPSRPDPTLRIAVSEHEFYDLGVSENHRESRQRIDQLEAELERYRSQEQLLAKTLVSATSHATAIRESARREAELALRKARTEAERLKSGAARERDEARRETIRLRRVTEQMRSGLSAFLTEKVEELRLETERATDSRKPDELEAVLGSVVEARATRPQSSAGGPHVVP